MPSHTAEDARLLEDRLGHHPWRRWGPYLADRAWGTVREDYSADGNAWNFLTHDMARSKAYRWGEDGIAGFCDRYQLLCFAMALWNGRDPILKERYFGLNPWEANHGEDVKEYYFHEDATPTHSYQKLLYKYPQAAFPYRWLLDENRRRNSHDPEFELLDTGIFDDDRYFDVEIEYAKASPEDVAMRVKVWNRGPVPAAVHVLPHLWFRNRWSWGKSPTPSPRISLESGAAIGFVADEADSEPLRNILFPYRLGKRYWYGPSGGRPLFTDNESNDERLYGVRNKSRYVKDAFHRHVIGGEACVNPDMVGTKACVHYESTVPPGDSVVFHFRLTDRAMADPLADVGGIVDKRKAEADEFYAAVRPPKASDDEAMVQRKAFAGLLWTKQSYLFDVAQWQDGDNPDAPPPPEHRTIRNQHWQHLNSMRILSMPDKWEYPWFAAWDQAFHAVPLAVIDPEFAKEQLWVLMFEQFQHPNGQIPAYEWEFSDLNPPVQAWAVWRVYNMDRIRSGTADREFLEKCFHKLLMNFAWWVNKVDPGGNNVFEGGFLGLDNVTVYDRSRPLPGGARLLQSDATGWMGMYCLNLMRIALELAIDNQAYLGLAVKFFEHFAYIGAALNRVDDDGVTLWNEDDGFYYDVLDLPGPGFEQFRVRSLVGLIPLFAVERLEEKWLDKFPLFRSNVEWVMANRKNLTDRCITTLDRHGETVRVLKAMTEAQMRRVLARVADAAEFHGPFGLRSLSKAHEEHPFRFDGATVGYEPAEAVTILKGGNSNWRGPVWFPAAFLMIESLRKLAKGFGQEYTFPAATHDGGETTFGEVAKSLADRMIGIFSLDSEGRRPVNGRRAKFDTDPHWKNHILFYEYFHGDTGAGLGASHQTGWTALVASLIDEWRR
ncbi:MAG TPA: glucosidase [Fimbriiglobus sp.]|jgi:hypothetical protein